MSDTYSVLSAEDQVIYEPLARGEDGRRACLEFMRGYQRARDLPGNRGERLVLARNGERITEPT